jgi:hypothetical protein
VRLIFIFLFLLAQIARADGTNDASTVAGASSSEEPLTAEQPSTAWPHVGPDANRDIANGEVAFNFGLVYASAWAFYLVSQNHTIIDEGSFQNWATYWYQPHFDNDSFEYNLFKHTLVGQGYYQFYRSRGYDVKRAFVWTFLSSLAFELTIETVTERPSFQDIYQTPVYGTILGIGLEKLSQACHRTETALGHVCGYLFDPFTLIPKSPKFALYPIPHHGTWIADLRWEF